MFSVGGGRCFVGGTRFSWAADVVSWAVGGGRRLRGRGTSLVGGGRWTSLVVAVVHGRLTSLAVGVVHGRWTSFSWAGTSFAVAGRPWAVVFVGAGRRWCEVVDVGGRSFSSVGARGGGRSLTLVGCVGGLFVVVSPRGRAETANDDRCRRSPSGCHVATWHLGWALVTRRQRQRRRRRCRCRGRSWFETVVVDGDGGGRKERTTWQRFSHSCHV